MLERLKIQNFRSIADADLQFGPMTVMFGPTASGKSTALYALLALRNFVLNPNQQADGLFNLGFQNLGGFDECVFDHRPDRAIHVEAGFRAEGSIGQYGMALQKTTAEIWTRSTTLDETSELKRARQTAILKATVPVPYPANQSFTFSHKEVEDEFTVNWNGIASTVAPKNPTPETLTQAQALATRLNAPAELLKRVDVAPHKRGFFKPNYTLVPLSPTPTSEDEVASLILSDHNLPSRISVDMETIFGRDFRTQVPLGTATALFQTTEKASRTPVLLVNDGFGVNQIVYLLAKIHRSGAETILIEEPEVHLHPSIVRNFARVACALVKEEGKQLIFTTHSEQFLISLLACVSDGSFAADDLKCLHAERDRKTSTFKEQRVLSNGQIEGGLSAFIESEMEDLKKFLTPRQ